MREEVAIRARITGRVQGVGFRAWTIRQAQALGLRGHVRNLADGSVELVALGLAESVDGLLRACRQGPAGARVEGIETRPEDVAAVAREAGPGFRQLPTV
ncbi:MAG: acylphosphatase [Alphaproteobacteria bacterium]|nr:acylphosphatase [Alphaproteobacteria bacterium]